MEKFGLSGLWRSVGSTVVAALVLMADGVVTYLAKVELPSWAHVVVIGVSALLAFYKGKAPPPVVGSPVK